MINNAHHYTHYNRIITMVTAKNITAALFVLLFIWQGNGRAQSKKIVPGDVIEIRVYGHDELSKTVSVEPNGTVNYPLISDIPIDGLRIDELREILITQAQKYLGERPIITVRFSQTLAVPVTVLGMVQIPGEYMVPRSATVQGAITMAGGFLPRAKVADLKLIRQSDEGGEAIRVNMQKFYEEADPSLLPGLEKGDIIVVPGVPGSQDVKVGGAVNEPGLYTAFQGANLMDLIYMAGGPAENADIEHVQLISPMRQEAREVVINMEELLNSNEMPDMPEIHPGDIIYVKVKEKGGFWNSFVSVVQNISAVVTPVLMIMWYYSRTKD